MAAKKEKLIELRPKFKLTENDHKQLEKTVKLLGVSKSQYIKMALEAHLGGNNVNKGGLK